MPIRFLAVAWFPAIVFAQGLEYVKANYTKYEHSIPMRDGVKLFTSIYVPKEPPKSEKDRYPIFLSRTPYSVAPYGVDKYKTDLGPDPKFARDGYIFVYQDVRGKWMSEGTFINMTPHKPTKASAKDIDESTDTYDTIDWLIKNIPNNNGRVGTYGISYPGFYTAAGMIDAHPAHVAASPQAPIVDWFTGDDFHRNGVLWLPHAFNFLASFGVARPEPTTEGRGKRFDHKTPDGYEFFLSKMGPLANANERFLKNEVQFWTDMMKHETYDEFWQSRNLRPHLKSIKPAVLTVGGWYDAENIYGALQVYGNVEKQGFEKKNMLAFGPWVHGGWARSDGDRLGDVRFASKTAEYYRDKVQYPFFKTHLKGETEAKLPKVVMFETGTNQWRDFDAWPPKSVEKKALYFHSKGKLSWDAPADGAGENYDEYISDPSKPVPYISTTYTGMLREYMTADQRFAASRPDVLVYMTEVLSGDVTLAGPIENELTVSTSGTDSDWVVKLIDVFPDDYPDNPEDAPPTPPTTAKRNPATYVRMGGYQQLVRGEMFRGKFRNSFSRPEAFTPNRATPVKYAMNDVFHTFRRGHRIMIQVQSSWFPLADRNPQKFMNIREAKESDFVKATQRLYRSRAAVSRVVVGVLK
ncbi:MAG: CocE/NonD family hydrolase [Bryobacteraceae bacterium]|nr:CocE/NonD family hydrolase [Bryobacteraceae bacterium]